MLQPRDYQLLRALATLRVIDREQAKRVAGFRSTTRANTRLLALSRFGLLMRHAVGTIAGGHKHLYALTAQGARVVQAAYRGKPWSDHTLLAGSLGLEHQLRLNDLYLLLVYDPIRVTDVSVRRWQTFSRSLSTTVSVIPDGYVEIDTPRGARGWFIEVDRGTESQRSWISKAQRYLAYAIADEFHPAPDVHQFGVLVIAPTARRLHSLRATVAHVTDKLFWFATFSVLDPVTFWMPVWWRPTAKEPQPLIPNLCAIAPTAGD